MKIDVRVPAVGESVQEGMISSWNKKSGDQVQRDELLCVLETDKASVDILSEATGVVELLAEVQKVVKIGDTIARIDTSGVSASPSIPAPTKAEQPKSPPAEPTSQPLLDPGPAVRKIAQEKSIDLSSMKGSGKNGRVTKMDLVSTPSPQTPELQTSSHLVEAALPQATGERVSTRKPMSMLRRKIAERLLSAQENAAILTTFNEIDMTTVIQMREKYKDAFQEKFGIKLGFMGFFVKASVQALLDYPNVNAYIEGDDLIYHNYCDVGVAVSTEKGLMVPVLRNVESMSLSDIELGIGKFSEKARTNKISLDDLSGGTFSVSNGGVFGSLLSTPILNPPQSAILGMHKTQPRPIAMDGNVVIRPMMYIALSYDHRIIDGKEAVGFLLRIKNLIEDPSRLVLGV